MNKKIAVGGLELKARHGRVCLRDVDLCATAETYGTPFFLYDWNSIAHAISKVKKNLSGDIKLYYAIKANPNIELLKRMVPLVDGVDIASAGEFRRVLESGFSPSQASFAGPGKTDEELTLAILQHIGSISVESLGELERIEKIAAAVKKRANVSIRINPLKPQKKFPVKMGGKPSPFGIDEEKWGDFFSRLKDLPHCDFVGVHVFSGTQCLDGKTLLDNIACILQIAKEIHRVTSLELKTVNFGGGFGVPYYEGQRPIDVDQVCAGMSGQFTQFKQETGLAHCTGVLELGRYLVAQAGAYVARIVDVKESRGKKFCVLDGGINHHLAAAGQLGKFIRENLQIINLSRADSGVTEQVSLVGPLCASLDIIGENVRIEKPEAGHYIAVLTSGAYAYTASPVLFLSHETPLELLIDGSQVSIIRQRHTTDADGV